MNATKRYFVDSNIFLRVAAKEDESTYMDCRNFLKLSENNKVYVVTSSLVTAEITWTLKSYYNFTKQEIIQTLEGINNLKIVFCDNFQNNIALSLFQKYNIKYIDSLIASIPEIYNKKWTVISYDKDFDKIGILRKEPREIL